MKKKLIIVLLNLIVLLCAYIFSLIPEPHKSVIINIFVGIGIFVFLIWSFTEMLNCTTRLQRM